MGFCFLFCFVFLIKKCENDVLISIIYFFENYTANLSVIICNFLFTFVSGELNDACIYLISWLSLVV